MAPRATQASQKQSASSRSKTSQSQSSRAKKGKGRRADDDDDEEEEEVEEEEEYGGGRGAKAGALSEEIHRKATDLIRLALFLEPKRGALRRDDINKKVLGGNPRSFNAIFSEAQDILRKTCGMELVELMTRIEKEKGLGGGGDDNDGQNIAGTKKKTPSTSKTYILRNRLDPILIEIANTPDQEIQTLAKQDLANGAAANDDDDDGPSQIADSTLIAWNSADHPALIGITHVILALILVGGRSLPDTQLRNQLKALNLHPHSTLPLPAHSTQKSLNLDTLLSELLRQNYLDRFKTSLGGAQSQAPAATQGKRGRASRVEEEGDADGINSWEWKWGSRALAEIGEEGVAEFVAKFMWERRGNVGEEEGEDEDDEEEEEEEEEEEPQGRGGRRGAAARGRAKKVKARRPAIDMKAKKKAFEANIINDITRTAGGELLGLKWKGD